MERKLVAITGASAGIGKAMAKEFAQKGFDLLLIARRENLLQELKKELEAKNKVKVSYELCDLSEPSEYKALAKKLAQSPITILVNNAGAGQNGELINQDEDKNDRLIVLLVNSLTYLSTAVGKQMAKRGGGTIVNIASGLAYAPYGPGIAVYAAAKKYVYDLSRAMQYENEKLKNNVQVITVQPGAIATEFQQVATGAKQPAPSPGALQLGDADVLAKDVINQVLAGKKIITSGPMAEDLRPSSKLTEQQAVDKTYELMKSIFQH